MRQCKSKLIDGDIELLKYSTFALPDYEERDRSYPAVPHACLQRSRHSSCSITTKTCCALDRR